MERLKQMKEQLTSTVQGQLGNLHDVDAKELGEVVDMIKDLAEAIYYCSITEAMEESSKEKPQMNNTYYYTMPMDYRDNGRMYYGGNQDSRNNNSSRPYYNNYRGNPVYYTPDMYREREYMPEYMMNDPREGRAKQSRRMYMESKEMHKDASTQMKELEKYIKDLSEDITEMIRNATPEEKQVLQQKIAMLSNKIM